MPYYNSENVRRGLYSLVDWNNIPGIIYLSHLVEAYTASWIEIFISVHTYYWHQSRFIQPRGLKFSTDERMQLDSPVEAYTASWIEINKNCVVWQESPVEAYTASWIEIQTAGTQDGRCRVEAYTASWIEIFSNLTWIQSTIVEAYTASWIEMFRRCRPHQWRYSRGLYSFTDWNSIQKFLIFHHTC